MVINTHLQHKLDFITFPRLPEVIHDIQVNHRCISYIEVWTLLGENSTTQSTPGRMFLLASAQPKLWDTEDSLFSYGNHERAEWRGKVVPC